MSSIFRIWVVTAGMLPIMAGAAEPVSEVTPQPTPTPAPEVFDLPTTIHRALAISPAIESAQSFQEYAEARLAEVKGAYILPETRVRVLGGVVPDIPPGSGPPSFPVVDGGISDLGPFIQVRIEAIQPLFTFGKLSSLKSAAQSGVEARKAGVLSVRNEVVYRVKTVYHALSYLFSLQQFLEELSQRAAKARELVEDKLLHHSPDTTDIDLMRLDVFQAETDRRLIELNSAVKLGLASLAVLIEAPRDKPIDIQDHDLRFREFEIQPEIQYMERAKSARPELRQLTELVAARRALIKVQEADYFPMFYLGGFYKFAEAPGRQEIDNPYLSDDFNINVGGGGLGLEQKLSFHMTTARRDQAKAEYQQALADQRQALQGIELEIKRAISNAVARRDSVKIALKGFKAGRSWVTATTLNFGVGFVPAKDLLEAFVAYSKVKVSFFDTIHEYDSAVAELSRAVGEEVTDLRY